MLLGFFFLQGQGQKKKQTTSSLTRTQDRIVNVLIKGWTNRKACGPFKTCYYELKWWQARSWRVPQVTSWGKHEARLVRRHSRRARKNRWTKCDKILDMLRRQRDSKDEERCRSVTRKLERSGEEQVYIHTIYTYREREHFQLVNQWGDIGDC